MKYSLHLLSLMLFLTNCSNKMVVNEINQKLKNEVIVLGTIQGDHLLQEEYGVEVLKELIVKIAPDIILAEIPPDHFEKAYDEFLLTDSVSDPRVKKFPEYTHVIFPLSKELEFEIIPTSGWTQEMADARSEKLNSININEDWKNKITAFNITSSLSDSLLAASGRAFDPYWIHTKEYDRIINIKMRAYEKLFRKELGDGSWQNTYKSHYSNIEAALDDYQFQEKKILITYVAHHKGWLLRELSKRKDINLLDFSDLEH